MKKVCVVTYCEHSSYGSIMQTIGLKKALLDLGYESFVLKDNPAPSANLPKKSFLKKNIKQALKNLHSQFIYKKLSLRYENTLKFINDHVDIIYYDNYDVLCKNFPYADYYIAGSDQIWHPQLCKPLFFLRFLDQNSKKISYAASMGTVDISKKNKDVFKEYVCDFDYLSVREKEVANVIDEFNQNSSLVHIDPTFLVDKNEWRKYAKPYNIKKPYILLYTIYWDKNLNKQLKQLHKKTGIDIVAISSSLNSCYANGRIYDADPSQFLWLIDNAEAVITSSFHGVAFSIIFNKKLVAVVNPASPSRIENLLKTLEVESSSIADVLSFDENQFINVNKRIEEERIKSLSYLQGVLNE